MRIEASEWSLLKAGAAAAPLEVVGSEIGRGVGFASPCELASAGLLSAIGGFGAAGAGGITFSSTSNVLSGFEGGAGLSAGFRIGFGAAVADGRLAGLSERAVSTGGVTAADVGCAAVIGVTCA